jgi:hypothetical protein
MSRLILHIGTHKTGTTSIQRFLDANRRKLAARGVFYPGYDLIGKPHHYAHIGIVNGFSGGATPFSAEDARAFFAAVRDRVADHDVTILSAEPFYRHFVPPSKGEVPEEPERYWPAREAYVERVAEMVGIPAEVVCVFRRQDSFAQSLYQESVKVSRQKLTFEQYLRQRWFHFAFLQQAEAWDRVFPGLRALSFERLAASGDLPGAFCDAIGVAHDDLARPARANEGLPVDLVVLKRILNATGVPRAELRRRVEMLAAHIDATRPDLREPLKARSFFSSGKARNAFHESFRDDNLKLRARFMRDIPKGEKVFPTGQARTKPRYGDALDPRAAEALLRLALDGVGAAS